MGCGWVHQRTLIWESTGRRPMTFRCSMFYLRCIAANIGSFESKVNCLTKATWRSSAHTPVEHALFRSESPTRAVPFPRTAASHIAEKPYGKERTKGFNLPPLTNESTMAEELDDVY